jgi:hypothetical protein
LVARVAPGFGLLAEHLIPEPTQTLDILWCRQFTDIEKEICNAEAHSK